jgi:hypothetical protein
MDKKRKFVNRGVFCGEVQSEPLLDHQIKNNDSGEVIKEYYAVDIEVEFENKNKTVKDVSVLPFLLTKEQMEEMGGVSTGDILFIKGEWRAYDRRLEDGRRQTVTRVLSRKAEKIEDFTRTRNKVEFEGLLKSKIHKAKFDEDGRLERDEKKRLVLILDEEGKKIPWIRKNPEGHVVNDFVLQVTKEMEKDGEMKVLYEDFIPCIAYGPVAWQIMKEIDIDTPVKARGYVRRRMKKGYEGEYVYEPVITRITPITEDQEVDVEAEVQDNQE